MRYVNYLPKLFEIACERMQVGDLFLHTRKAKYVDARMICAAVLYRRYHYNGNDLFKLKLISERSTKRVERWIEMLDYNRKLRENFTYVNTAFRHHIDTQAALRTAKEDRISVNSNSITITKNP